MTSIEFRAWPKTLRLSKTSVVITEKIDGTNACVVVTEDGQVHAQSRKRLITPDADNYGFAGWVADHEEELKELGPGYHYGEWYGNGIQRGYGLDHKRFALFDVNYWSRDTVPPCCGVVPVLGRCSPIHMGDAINYWVKTLAEYGSEAVPDFMRPEGICVTHDRRTYKVLLENDDLHKGQVAA